jgi:hypothetical protein
MGRLKIISVTGAVPHSACHFDFADIKYKDCWRGFGPAEHHSPAGKGKVFTDDETHRINHWITFKVDDTTLIQACSKVSAAYQNASYLVGGVDCVSFSADVARQCGLGVPLVNLTPYGLIKILQLWNDSVEDG